eukprot:gene490-10262_t
MSESSADAADGGVKVTLKLFGVAETDIRHTRSIVVPLPFTFQSLQASVEKAMHLMRTSFQLVSRGHLITSNSHDLKAGATVTVVPKNRAGHHIGQHSTAGRAIDGMARGARKSLADVKEVLEKLPVGKGKLSMVISEIIGNGEGTPEAVVKALAAAGAGGVGVSGAGGAGRAGGWGGGACAGASGAGYDGDMQLKEEDLPASLALGNRSEKDLSPEERRVIAESHDRYVAGVKLKKQVEKRKTSENNKTSSTLAMLHKKRALLKERKERRKAARNASKNGTGVAGKTVRVATIKAIKAAKIVKAATRSKSSPATASSSTSSSSSSFGGLKKGFLL